MTTFKNGDRVRVTFEGTVAADGHWDDLQRLRVSVGRPEVARVYPEDCELIAPTGGLGPFDERAGYPTGTIAVNDCYGGSVARLDREGIWQMPGGETNPRYWLSPTVVYIGRTA